MSPFIVCAALIAAGPPARVQPDPTPAALDAYRAERGKAGRDPDAHVRLALWCESRGLEAERLEHLALAVLADPKHAAARGLLGLVPFRGRWEKPEAVAERVRSDADLAAALAEYNVKRAKTPNKADAQWLLALWCEKRGLSAEATAHFTNVTRLDPGRDAAWKRLGYKRHRGRWRTGAQIAAVEADRAAQAVADKEWLPRLQSYRDDLGSRKRRDAAEAALARVDDPRAVRSVWRVFGRGTSQARAVQVLGQIDAPEASRALAALAIDSEWSEVRRLATETLRNRDPRDFAAPLIALLRDPVRYAIRPVGGPGSPGALVVEGADSYHMRVYNPPPAQRVRLLPTDELEFDEFGLPVIARYETYGGTQTVSQATFTPAQYQGQAPLDPNQAALRQQALANPANNVSSLVAHSAAGRPGIVGGTPQLNSVSVLHTIYKNMILKTQIPIGRMWLEAQRAAAVTRSQLEGDAAQVEQVADAIRRANSRVESVLEAVAGRTQEDREAWRAWLVDQRGFTAKKAPRSPKPTFVEEVAPAYLPRRIEETSIPLMTGGGALLSVSADVSLIGLHCFGAGTPVHTLSGPRPIEALRVGDRVLAQDATTGALSVEPVLAVHRTATAPTLRLYFKGQSDAIVTTGIHRFWKAGKGWVMARDLKGGDRVRIVGGTASVESVEDGEPRAVYNLDVAGAHSFFVGRRGALVQDTSPYRPVAHPFDTPPELARAGRP